MSDSQGPSELHYELMVQDALRGVVRDALKDTAENGLPGAHHFYLALDVNHSGVSVPDFLREKFPDELTVVIQHQFEDLEVDDDGFAVTLFFDGKEARITATFKAVKGFFDPSVQFGLQFSTDNDGQAPKAVVPANADGDGPSGDDTDPSDPNDPKPTPPDGGKPDAPKTGEVVSLDQFRKK